MFISPFLIFATFSSVFFELHAFNLPMHQKILNLLKLNTILLIKKDFPKSHCTQN